MRTQPGRIGTWLALLAAGVFAAGILYSFIVTGSGSRTSNPLTGQVVPWRDHGTTVFVTRSQHGLFVGSLVFAAAAFIAGAVIFEKNRMR